jgi:hypothetical protein
MLIRTIATTVARLGGLASLAGLAGLAAAALALTACGPPASSARAAAKPVTMTDCNGLHHTTPPIVTVICQSDAITARNLTWSAWGTPVATAIGAAVVDACAFEDCHTATYSAYRIVVIASKIVKCAKGRQVYSRLQYVFVGHSPFADLPTKGLGIANSLFGSHRPGPPHNDTVSLPC